MQSPIQIYLDEISSYEQAADEAWAVTGVASRFIRCLLLDKTLGPFALLEGDEEYWYQEDLLKKAIIKAFVSAYGDELSSAELKKYLNHRMLKSNGTFYKMAFWHFFLKNQYIGIANYECATFGRANFDFSTLGFSKKD